MTRLVDLTLLSAHGAGVQHRGLMQSFMVSSAKSATTGKAWQLTHDHKGCDDRSLQEDEHVRAVGQLSSRETYDTRFVTDDAPLGRLLRELAIAVLRIERAGADDIDGSWVELQAQLPHRHDYGGTRSSRAWSSRARRCWCRCSSRRVVRALLRCA